MKFGEWTKERPEMIFATIQEEMVVWQDHNFPGRESWCPLMGLGEELGELSGAMEPDDIIDAIGDCLIYLADYCNAMNHNLQELFSLRLTFDYVGTYAPAFQSYGKICHAHLKNHQNIRMHEDHSGKAKEGIGEILNFLSSFQRNIDDIAWDVWIKVRERDWQKNRNSAHEEVKEVK